MTLTPGWPLCLESPWKSWKFFSTFLGPGKSLRTNLVLESLQFSQRGPWKCLNVKLVSNPHYVKNGAVISHNCISNTLVLIIDLMGCFRNVTVLLAYYTLCHKSYFMWQNYSGIVRKKRSWGCLKILEFFLKTGYTNCNMEILSH